MEFAIELMVRYDETNPSRSATPTGIGPNVLVARLATRQAKPNGQHRVPRSCVMNFLADLPVERLHGVGYRTAEKLTELGVTTVRQLRALSKEMLQRQLGPKQGQVRGQTGNFEGPNREL